jgi:hypothetical protein
MQQPHLTPDKIRKNKRNRTKEEALILSTKSYTCTEEELDCSSLLCHWTNTRVQRVVT